MLLDIAKESTDAFPPLKSCLGGINALIKHYEVRRCGRAFNFTDDHKQQYSDVKDKLDDLIPWVKKLLVSLAKANPNDDRDEVERRSELAKFVSRLESLVHSKLIRYDRSLEDIGTRSLALSEKGKVARILDKAQDTGEVVKLIEQLRRAILIYQVTIKYVQNWKLLTCWSDVTTTVIIHPGRPIDREFLPLESDFETNLMGGQSQSSFDAFLKLRQVTEHKHDRRY